MSRPSSGAAGGLASQAPPLAAEVVAGLLGDAGRAEAAAIRHLERSNDELRAALLSGEDDDDFREALRDNEAVLQRKYARLREISGRSPCTGVAAVSFTAANAASGASSAAPLAGLAGSGDVLAQMKTLLGQVKRKAVGLQEAAASPQLDISPPPSSAARASARGGVEQVKRKADEMQGRASATPLHPPALPAPQALSHDHERRYAGVDEPREGAAGGGLDLGVGAWDQRCGDPSRPCDVCRLRGLLSHTKRKAAALEEVVLAGDFGNLTLFQSFSEPCTRGRRLNSEPRQPQGVESTMR